MKITKIIKNIKNHKYIIIFICLITLLSVCLVCLSKKKQATQELEIEKFTPSLNFGSKNIPINTFISQEGCPSEISQKECLGNISSNSKPNPGPAGRKGSTGPKGLTGTPGLKGDKGQQGPKGDDGQIIAGGTPVIWETNSEEDIYLNTNNWDNVGIGITNPTDKLSVNNFIYSEDYNISPVTNINNSHIMHIQIDKDCNITSKPSYFDNSYYGKSSNFLDIRLKNIKLPALNSKGERLSYININQVFKKIVSNVNITFSNLTDSDIQKTANFNPHKLLKINKPSGSTPQEFANTIIHSNLSSYYPKWIRIDRSKINFLNLSSQARININIELKPIKPFKNTVCKKPIFMKTFIIQQISKSLLPRFRSFAAFDWIERKLSEGTPLYLKQGNSRAKVCSFDKSSGKLYTTNSSTYWQLGNSKYTTGYVTVMQRSGRVGHGVDDFKEINIRRKIGSCDGSSGGHCIQKGYPSWDRCKECTDNYRYY